MSIYTVTEVSLTKGDNYEVTYDSKVNVYTFTSRRLAVKKIRDIINEYPDYEESYLPEIVDRKLDELDDNRTNNSVIRIFYEDEGYGVIISFSTSKLSIQ